MIISLNWLKKYTTIDLPLEELTTLIGSRLVEIEDVTNLGEKYKDVVVVRVIECRPVEDSDHLSVTKVDDGGVVNNVERDENGYVQVVCGAHNVRQDMLAAWLPPRSVVPETVNDEEPFILGARKLRGYMSNGMLASARELDLYNDHEGILDIDKEVSPGTRFNDVYELDDILIDIENKSLTHRPDAFGIIGFAREVAGIQRKAFETPEWLRNLEPSYGDMPEEKASLIVTVEDPELAPRYQAVVLHGAEGAAKSPIAIQTYLARVGVRPISAVVDVTNYLMLLSGQPLHAFDYDKVVAISGGEADIRVRRGVDGETLELLDGRVIELSVEDIVIAAGETPIGLAGAMGGASTEIDANTKNIILESATFNLYNLRSTQMRHGIFSEAITRFTKGQPAPLTAPVLSEAVRLMNEWAGARRVSDVADVYMKKSDTLRIQMTEEKVNSVLGSAFTADNILETLRIAEFDVTLEGNNIYATAPYWRADISTPEDIIEEVGRVNGYDTIVPTLPVRAFSAVRPSAFDELKTSVRHILVRAGANEVLTYSFVHGDVLHRAGQQADNSYKIVNSISPDLQYYRQSLTPSLLGLVHPNIKAGNDSFVLFEINKIHDKASGMTQEQVPIEHSSLSLVVTHRKAAEGDPFYQAKAYMDFLSARLNLRLSYEPLDASSTSPWASPFELKRSAIISDASTGVFVGVIGAFKASVMKNFKLPEYTAGFEVDMEALHSIYSASGMHYAPLTRYPGTERDISFRVDTTVPYSDIVTAASEALKSPALASTITPLDIYQGEESIKKTITIRIGLIPFDKTLTSKDVLDIMSKVEERVHEKTDATIA